MRAGEYHALRTQFCPGGAGHWCSLGGKSVEMDGGIGQERRQEARPQQRAGPSAAPVGPSSLNVFSAERPMGHLPPPQKGCPGECRTDRRARSGFLVGVLTSPVVSLCLSLSLTPKGENSPWLQNEKSGGIYGSLSSDLPLGYLQGGSAPEEQVTHQFAPFQARKTKETLEQTPN